MPIEREVTIEEFRAHINALPPTRRIDEVFVHHTWRPTAADYRGIATVAAVRRYHMETNGWRDNGYHVMFGPDGKIFLCRPIPDVGAHAAPRNSHSIGVSFIANFDSDDPTEYEGMESGYRAVAALLQRYQLEPENIRFHREVAPKTCPGMKLGLAGFRSEVGRRLGEEAHGVTAIVNGTTLEGEVVEIRDGQLWVWVRPIVEAVPGSTVEWDDATKTATFTIGGE